MTKKGELTEWMSRIRYGLEDLNDFSIIFRDFDEYIELSFVEFSNLQQEKNIPLHRISQIRRKGISVFTRPNFCTKCGHPLKEKKCWNFNCDQYNKDQFF
ncbi:MAG: RNA repair domain-containing protein [Candidatus Hodarchaeota archaeon]